MVSDRLEEQLQQNMELQKAASRRWGMLVISAQVACVCFTKETDLLQDARGD